METAIEFQIEIHPAFRWFDSPACLFFHPMIWKNRFGDPVYKDLLETGFLRRYGLLRGLSREGWEALKSSGRLRWSRSYTDYETGCFLRTRGYLMDRIQEFGFHSQAASCADRILGKPVVVAGNDHFHAVLQLLGYEEGTMTENYTVGSLADRYDLPAGVAAVFKILLDAGQPMARSEIWRTGKEFLEPYGVDSSSKVGDRIKVLRNRGLVNRVQVNKMPHWAVAGNEAVASDKVEKQDAASDAVEKQDVAQPVETAVPEVVVRPVDSVRPVVVEQLRKIAGSGVLASDVVVVLNLAANLLDG